MAYFLGLIPDRRTVLLVPVKVLPNTKQQQQLIIQKHGTLMQTTEIINKNQLQIKHVLLKR